jgi:threonylcarbamoyladenosine tRNA methylthiotransferase MtaB
MADPARPRAAVVNLGCKVNRVESDWIESSLVDAGCTLVPEDRADLVVVNTCAVTGEAQAKTRKAVRRAALQPGRPLVVVTGCTARLFPDELAALAPNVTVCTDKQALVAQALETWSAGVWDAPLEPVGAASGQAGPCAQKPCGEPAPAEGADADAYAHGAGVPPEAPHAAFRARRGVKVQDGCDNACTYCIVWRARGPVRSEPLDRIERQVRRVLDEGACEVVLSGINLGRFRACDGSGAEVGLAGLLDRVCAWGAPFVRVGSVEPPDLTDEVIEALARNAGRVAPHLHLPLQSGCDAVLARMGRRYTAAQFAERVARARAALPRISLSTDVIVGFPGETDDDFEETLAFCAAMGFSKVHAFRYSARPDTPAAHMGGQVGAAAMRERSERLRDLGAALRAADARARVGDVEQVLVERVDGQGRAFGTTASYHDVVFEPGTHACAGAGLVRARLTGVRPAAALLEGRVEAVC